MILVGPSGCGKSTTLRMIAGLEEISSGELWIDGTLMNLTVPQKRDLSMVFQSYALYPHLTVYENMAFSLRVRNVMKTEIDKRVRKAADVFVHQPLTGPETPRFYPEDKSRELQSAVPLSVSQKLI